MSGQTLKDSADAERARYRICVECGARMHVTYLIPKRTYACAKCGFPFHHHPALAEENPEAKSARKGLSRLLPLMLVAGGLPWLLPMAFSFQVLPLRVAMVSGAAAFLTLVGALWVRGISRDPAGSVSVMLTILGFAALALLFLREIGGQSPDEVAKLEWRLTF
ncbi:MAG: hypothetical protein KDB07_10945, partial [Planctomycetes bacterium]|nr:hypothetical protein [Planctomycetota bacterium]